MKRALGPYQGIRIRLRLLEEKDLPMTLAWRNKERCRKAFRTTDVIAPEHHRAWYDNHYREKENDFIFVIETPARPVGQIALYGTTSRDGELGRLMIGEDDALRKGYALEAVECVRDRVTKDLGLTEIYLQVRDDNKAAIRLYRRAGFIEDGWTVEPAGRFLWMIAEVP